MKDTILCSVICIPSYKPDHRLIDLIEALKESGCIRIVITDDGGGPEYAPVFTRAEELGCVVVRHEHNLGKGAALKTAIEKAVLEFGPETGIVTADADGQHLPQDIVRVSDALTDYPDHLILGVRDFSRENVPLKSALGNKITSGFFRLATGVACCDTQTGLRGIPPKLLPLAQHTEGDRYDYEMNFLVEAVKSTPLIMIPIETVYENGNAGSHFHTFRDSFLIYKKPLQKLGLGLTAAGLAAAAAKILRRNTGD